MSTKKGWRYHAGQFILVSVSLAVFLMMVFGLHKATSDHARGWGSSDAAGWMQAIGAFLSIGTAILVTQLQLSAQEKLVGKNQAEELAGILNSLRCEIEITSRNAATLVGSLIKGTKEGEGVFVTYPVPEAPFNIYYGVIPKLGLIKTEGIRVKIVETYAFAASFVATIRYNNELVEKWEASRLAAARTQTKIDVLELERTHAAVCNYGNGVRRIYNEAMTQAMDLIEVLRSAHIVE